jgi:hypothetical protein
MMLPTGSSVDSSSREKSAALGASDVSDQSVSMAGCGQFGSKRRERGSKLMVDIPDGGGTLASPSISKTLAGELVEGAGGHP